MDRSLDNLIIGFNKKEEDLAKKENREPQFLPHIHPHMFRHTFATKCFEKNIPPKIVQKYLGHASVKTALDVYTHKNARNIVFKPFSASCGQLRKKVI